MQDFFKICKIKEKIYDLLIINYYLKMRIPITTHPNHICLHKKDIAYFFGSKKLQIAQKFPQHNLFQYKENLILTHKEFKIELSVYSCYHKKTEIHISQKASQQLNLNAPIQLPGNLQNAKWVNISHKEKSKFFPENTICIPPHITMSQADAEEHNYLQGQKISPNIPYKEIKLPTMKIKIKDYFLIDCYIMEDDTEQFWLIKNDRLHIR